MSEVARRRANYADLLAAPDDRIAELIDGDLILSPRPTGRHSAAASEFIAQFGAPFGRGKNGPGGWILLFEPELHLGQAPQVLVPDLAGWRRARLPVIPNQAFFTLAPDWVCEVLSPSTAGLDRIRKLALYAEFGVSHVWLIDPGAKTLEVLQLENGRWVIVSSHADGARVRGAPFEAVELELGLFWADASPEP